jgi:hypothetical protein
LYKHDTRAHTHTHTQLQTNHKLSLLVASKRDPLNPSWLMEADSALYLNELLLVSGLKEKTTKETIAKLLGATTVQVSQSVMSSLEQSNMCVMMDIVTTS